MARPQKEGLDYWPRDVDLSEDPKLSKPIQKYGYLAIGVYETVLDLIYKDKGYYIDYSDPDDVAFSVRKRLDGKYQPDINLVKNIIELLIATDLFSRRLCQNEKILTSRRIQKTYYSATVDRIGNTINLKYWLLTLMEMAKLSKRHSLYKELVNRPKKGINRPKNSTKQSKEYLEEEEENACEAFDLYGHYEFLFSTELTNGQRFDLKSLIKGYGEGEVLEVMEDMKDRDIKHPLRYIHKVLVDQEKRREVKENMDE